MKHILRQGWGFEVGMDFCRANKDIPIELAPAEHAKPGHVIGYIKGEPDHHLGFMRAPRVRVHVPLAAIVEVEGQQVMTPIGHTMRDTSGRLFRVDCESCGGEGHHGQEPETGCLYDCYACGMTGVQRVTVDERDARAFRRHVQAEHYVAAQIAQRARRVERPARQASWPVRGLDDDIPF